MGYKDAQFCNECKKSDKFHSTKLDLRKLMTILTQPGPTLSDPTRRRTTLARAISQTLGCIDVHHMITDQNTKINSSHNTGSTDANEMNCISRS